MLPLQLLHILAVQSEEANKLFIAASNALPKDSLIQAQNQAVHNSLDSLSNMSGGEILGFITEKSLHFGLRILAAIAIYIVGGWLIKRLKKVLKKIFEKRKTEPSIASFLLSLISISLTVILVIITINALGVDTTSFIAILGGAGLAIGMAMSGTLQNLAGGIMILLFKPFKVGDLIEAQGYEGIVKSIEIASTHITTFNNEKIILPNGTLFNGVIKNSTQTGQLRCQWNVRISYGDDVEVAKNEIIRILTEDEKILNDKTGAPRSPEVVVKSLDESSVTLYAKAWCRYEDFWDTRYRINEKIYKELPSAGVHFPYPKMDINITNNIK